MKRSPYSQILPLSIIFAASRLIQVLAMQAQLDDYEQKAFDQLVEIFINDELNSAKLSENDSLKKYAELFKIGTLTLDKTFCQSWKKQASSYQWILTNNLYYGFSTLKLANKTHRRSALHIQLDKFRQQQKKRLGFFGNPTHPQLLASFAEYYHQQYKDIKPRIQIQGLRSKLTNQQVIDAIRTCLLISIWAGIKWRQSGGRRWKLIFKRKEVQGQINQLVQHLFLGRTL